MEKEVSETSVLKKKLKKEEILQRINDTVSLAYESALNSGLQTVKAALSKSTFDGDPNEHDNQLKKMKKFAGEIWEQMIVTKIKNNEAK